MRSFLWAVALAAAVQALPGTSKRQSGPEVTIDYGTFRGNTAFPGVNSFLGMPFAKAGRLQNPRVMGAEDRLEGVQDATKYGDACPQVQLVASPGNGNNAALGSLLAAVEQVVFAPVGQQSEDCLFVNVQVPEGVNETSNLPVIFWIHGGGFELGASSALGSETTALPGLLYQGANIVTRSLEMNQPVVFVSANHRLNAFGTLASQEITDAGVTNLVLKDQREAMRWIQKYIRNFGGDPEKVTLFGESAGSMSISTHMVLNNGDTEGLFRGAIMASGGLSKWLDYTTSQETFDLIAERSGCGDAEDKLACLREVDYDRMYNAVQQLPNFFSYESTKVPWYPRPDGTYLVDSPHRLAAAGKIADIPYIIGDMEDEGTLFSIVPSLNITTDEHFRDFWKTVFFPHLNDEQIRAFTDLYSQDPREGSPFGTGILNNITPQYKRIAASVGDYTFQAGRRTLLDATPHSKSWTYLQSQSFPILGQIPPLNALGVAQLPILGSFHVSDVVLNAFGTVPASISQNTLNLMSVYISFVNSLDPNNHGLEDLPEWPQYDSQQRQMFHIKEDGCEVIRDDYRDEQLGFINDNADTYRF